ncbi:MAG: histidine phosphatase family protein [Pseudomonadales bacterium]
MKLWLVRHAKSDWNSHARSDFERPLNRRGERDGPAMAAWLAGQADPATWIWTSDAVRARATTDFVAVGFAAADPQVVAEHGLYGATPETLLDVLRGTPADVHSAAVVAHNPGLTELLNLLAGEHLSDNLPTFGVARLEVPGPWATLAFGQARVELLTSPKRLGTL